MLRPIENAFRDARRLDGLWEFRADPLGVGRVERWWAASLTDSRPMPVPASYNDIYVDPTLRDLVGEAWYQRHVVVPAGWTDQRIALRLDSATHRATVFWDDVELMSHEGGYTPFEADVTALARPGETHRLTVVVDNTLSWQSIPPGEVRVRADGSRRQEWFHDFANLAGLHRSVRLCATPKVHFEDVTVVTDRDGTDGIVRVRVDVAGESADVAAVKATLTDADGVEVASTVGPPNGEIVLVVPDARLWQPGEGYRYALTLAARDAHDGVLDRYGLAVGIRTVRVDGTRFFINDEPFAFKGFGMHEDHLVRGKGHDDASVTHDFALLDWIGANSLRTSHYPYAEEWLDLADRLGVVVIDETAAVGLNAQLSGGLAKAGAASTFCDQLANEATRATHARAITELIERDKNHPCVVLWSIANEPESDSQAAHDYFAPLFDVARAADPTRPVGFVNVMLAPADRCRVSELADVVMVNRYYGWYVDHGDLVDAERHLEAELRAWAERFAKPIIVTEYGADTIAGLHTVDATPWSEEFQVELLDTYHRVFDRVEAVVGEHVWNFADFATKPSFYRVEGNKKGVFTRDRRPKAAAHALRRRWRGPVSG